MCKKSIITLLLFVGIIMPASAVESVVRAGIYFIYGHSEIDPDFADNRRQLQSIVDALNSMGPGDRIVRAAFGGYTSLEGTHENNQALALSRRNAMENFVSQRYPLAPDAILRDNEYINWGLLQQIVTVEDIPYKEEILPIISQPKTIIPYYAGMHRDQRLTNIRWTRHGAAWDVLEAKYFPYLRLATVELIIDRAPQHVYQPDPEPVYIPEPVEEVAEAPVETPEVEFVPCKKKFYIKTNLLNWLIAQSNVGLEVDFARHWSIGVHANYSAWNYFKNTLKFRTLDIRPGIRYWISPCNTKWYFGAHFGVAWYNYAFDGEYRYQDHDRRSPAIGGGIDIGYRLPLSANHRWNVEFGLSGGVYMLHYDKFINVKNGLKAGDEKKTYIGPDGASITFSYSF